MQAVGGRPAAVIPLRVDTSWSGKDLKPLTFIYPLLPLKDLASLSLVSKSFCANLHCDESWAFLAVAISEAASYKFPPGVRYHAAHVFVIAQTPKKEDGKTDFHLPSVLWDGALSDKLSLVADLATVGYYIIRKYNEKLILPYQDSINAKASKLMTELNLIQVNMSINEERIYSNILSSDELAEKDDWINVNQEKSSIRSITISSAGMNRRDLSYLEGRITEALTKKMVIPEKPPISYLGLYFNR